MRIPDRWLLMLVVPVLLLAASPSILLAGGPCAGLKGDSLTRARAIMASQHPYDCCDETIASCLKKRPLCRLVRRLADDICRRAAAGQSRRKIIHVLSRRARSMMSMGKPAGIALSAGWCVGPATSKVVLVMYACARCPFCAKLTPKLHRLVTRGALQGKVRLCLRPFPIRTHRGSVQGALALVGAARSGKCWPYLLKLYSNFGSFKVANLSRYAIAAGACPKKVAHLSRVPAARAFLVASKKEGIRNRVIATPTFFLNGRRYVGELKLPALQDVLEEELDRVGRRKYVGR